MISGFSAWMREEFPQSPQTRPSAGFPNTRYKKTCAQLKHQFKDKEKERICKIQGSVSISKELRAQSYTQKDNLKGDIPLICIWFQWATFRDMHNKIQIQAVLHHQSTQLSLLLFPVPESSLATLKSICKNNLALLFWHICEITEKLHNNTLKVMLMSYSGHTKTTTTQMGMITTLWVSASENRLHPRWQWLAAITTTHYIHQLSTVVWISTSQYAQKSRQRILPKLCLQKQQEDLVTVLDSTQEMYLNKSSIVSSSKLQQACEGAWLHWSLAPVQAKHLGLHLGILTP